MTGRQIALIQQLVAACWAHDEKLGAKILLELLGKDVNDQIAAKVSEMIEPGKGKLNG